MSAISARMIATDAAFASVKTFYNSRYGERRLVPGICDFTFGNPHEMPLKGIVTAIRERAIPHDKNWFAYKTSEQNSQATIAERLSQELDLTFEPEDIALTAGAFAAIMVAFRLVVDAGDEVSSEEYYAFGCRTWECVKANWSFRDRWCGSYTQFPLYLRLGSTRKVQIVP
jgi:aspartate aminotransferase